MPWAVKVYERIRRRQVLEFGRDIHPEDYVFMPHAASRDNAMKLLARQFEIVLEVTGLKLSTAGETRTLYSLRHSSIMFRLMFVWERCRYFDSGPKCQNKPRDPEFISSWGKHVDFIRFYFETCPYKRVTGLIWLGKLTFKALNTLASSGLMVPTPDMGSDPLMETR